ncbi:MAG: Rpn family recombination-promoting nuclease/putative transposase [Spirochaetales bacterium]|nr:Rpn family recombination-promoting nuclease/putative transposase [Spirochaetales bacterium]
MEMRDRNVILSNQMQIHFFEIVKMDLKGQTSFSTRLEKWAYFFKKEGLADCSEVENLLLKGDSIMQKAHENYQKFTREDQYRELYEAREKARKDEASRTGQARREGREEGRGEGLGEAIRKLKRHGMNADKISELLELPLSEVEGYLKK